MIKDIDIGNRVEHDRYGEGIVSKINLTSYEIYFAKGGKMEILKSNDGLSVIESTNTEKSSSEIDINEFEKLFTYILDKYGLLQEEVPLGEKWIGGKLIIQSSNTNLKPKEIPVEAFFHKIVMVRDKLRVLEQNINSHKNLTNEEKINLQQYITKIYGSLTTFNVLFNDKEYYFKGSGD